MIKLPQVLTIRQLYLDKVKPFMGKGLIKVLTGQRRVGKSYLLFQLIKILQEKDLNTSIIYINKEDLDFSWIRHMDLRSFLVQSAAFQ